MVKVAAFSYGVRKAAARKERSEVQREVTAPDQGRAAGPEVKRVFYVALGATAGVLIVRKLSRTAEQLTPAGLSSSLTGALGGLGDAIRDFGADVRLGMAEREDDLRGQLGPRRPPRRPRPLDAAARAAAAEAAGRYADPRYR